MLISGRLSCSLREDPGLLLAGAHQTVRRLFELGMAVVASPLAEPLQAEDFAVGALCWAVTVAW